MILAYHGQNYVYVMLPVTVSKDTPFHLAVYSERREPLQGLLDIVNRNPTLGNPLTKKNTYGNTVLHEAVVAGNMEAVKLLLQTVPREQGEFHPSEQLQARNKLGETTLYRAASCGDKEMVEYLAKLPGQISYGKLLEDHRKRGDLTPILHAAILGQHFETALTLLKLDPSLGDMTDDQGMTCLHLLADMPSAFKSGYAIPTISIRKLLYCCMFNAIFSFSFPFISLISIINKLTPARTSALKGFPPQREMAATRAGVKKDGQWWKESGKKSTSMNLH